MKFKAQRRRIGSKLKRFATNLPTRCRGCGMQALWQDLVPHDATYLCTRCIELERTRKRKKTEAL